MTDQQSVPSIAKEAVLAASHKIADETPVVLGYDFNAGLNYDALLQSYVNSGFQATNFGKAVQEINKMVRLYILSCCLQRHDTTCFWIAGQPRNRTDQRQAGPVRGRRIHSASQQLHHIPGLHLEHGVVGPARNHPLPGSA